MVSGRWTQEEHDIFMSAMERWPKQWSKIASLIKTRTVVQIRTHAQKCWKKKEGDTGTHARSDKVGSSGNDINTSFSDDISAKLVHSAEYQTDNIPAFSSHDQSGHAVADSRKRKANRPQTSMTDSKRTKTAETKQSRRKTELEDDHSGGGGRWIPEEDQVSKSPFFRTGEA